MVDIRPFAALRPKPELAGQICELPYDVMSTEEARQTASGNAISFLHVSKPEIDLPTNISPYEDTVYKKGLENFQALISRGCLRQDPRPFFYLYRQTLNSHRQVGLVAVASCDDYLHNVVKRHELTRPDKELDRVRHIETLNAQTGPVFLTGLFPSDILSLIENKVADEPWADFTAKDGVQHTGWIIDTPAQITQIQDAFRRLPALYIADGHHRSAAAARVCQARQGTGFSTHFLSVIFPHDQLRILAYNRAVKDLNGHTPGTFLAALRKVLVVSDGSPNPEQSHRFSLYLDHRWYTVAFPQALLASTNLVDRLDTQILQQHVLSPILGIADPRTSDRIGFIGGIRGTPELERLVDRGDFACAFSLFPTQVRELMAVADSGAIMPPKSTWFEPKLRDGMYCHLL